VGHVASPLGSLEQPLNLPSDEVLPVAAIPIHISAFKAALRFVESTHRRMSVRHAWTLLPALPLSTK
jgi:hypothetical protein